MEMDNHNNNNNNFQYHQTSEDNDDGLFHEQELRKRQKLMGMRRARGSKYDSPFGADIGGLG